MRGVTTPRYVAAVPARFLHQRLPIRLLRAAMSERSASTASLSLLSQRLRCRERARDDRYAGRRRCHAAGAQTRMFAVLPRAAYFAAALFYNIETQVARVRGAF